MVLIPVLCPHCQSDNVVKRGKSDTGQQRYLCKNDACPYGSFRLTYAYTGRLPDIKQQIVEMALNGSGIRDTARVSDINPMTVITILWTLFTHGNQPLRFPEALLHE
jgi:transposase-like protein